jgi:hypothetical protein
MEEKLVRSHEEVKRDRSKQEEERVRLMDEVSRERAKVGIYNDVVEL